jgi:hypothetical protein
MTLAGRPLSEFYSEFMERLKRLGIGVPIWPVPVEMPEAVPFHDDRGHSVYDPAVAQRFWRILLHADNA